MTASTTAQRFFELFDGSPRAHGRYEVPRDVEPGEKAEGKALTVYEAVTPELWQQHLDGLIGLGIVPLNDAGLCRWGAIDVDDYTLDLREVSAKVRQLELPLIVCRTKSGGAHLYVFLTEPAGAELVRESLLNWAAALGYPRSEIFPKQLATGVDNLGNWLNMPYQAGDRSLRYALDPDDGEALDPDEFLDVAYDLALSPITVATLRLEPAPVFVPAANELGGDPERPGIPPCLEKLLREGLPPHSRNETLFNLALYWKRVDEASAPDRARAEAADFKPQLSHREVNTAIRSAMRRPYNYRCRNEPLVSSCDREACLKRKHGVAERARARPELRARGQGGLQPDLQLGALIKVLASPAYWIWEVNGRRVQFEVDDLVNQRLFARQVLLEVNIVVQPMRQNTWMDLVTRAVIGATIEVPAKEATDVGRVYSALHSFCTGRAVAKTMDELLLGKPFHHEGRVYFLAPAFLEFCTNHRIPVTERKLYRWLTERGLEHSTMTLKGKTVEVWSVPEFTTQTEPFDVPRDPTQEGATF